MAKSSFRALERACWNSIYGVSRGPSSGRLKILVEDFMRLGLTPAMIRISDELLPFDMKAFQTAIQEAFASKEDDFVQVYYHPVECERVVGSTATTWVQWGRLILETEGLIPKGDEYESAPFLVENVPRIRLPVEARDALLARGVTTSSVCSLVSARIVAFFIAAQYEAWATPTEVVQVGPFKDVLRRLGFVIRDCDVRRDKGVEEILAGLDTPAVRQPVNAPIAGTATAVAPMGEVPAAAVLKAVPAASNLDEVDLDAEIAATEARLRALLQQLRARRVENIRKEFLAARVGDVQLDESGGLQAIQLVFPNGSFAIYHVTLPRPKNDVDSLLDDLVEHP